MINKHKKCVVLAILDGWGIASEGPGNAITLANTPNIDRLTHSFPHTELSASGEAVGLPRGEDGNTETGHLNIGAGRIVYQDLERINMAIAEGSFFDNQVLNGAIDHATKNNSNVHYMGLIGAGGVHSDIHHLYALIQLAKRRNFERVYLHLFTDGRDSPTTAAKTYINELYEVLNKEHIGKVATLMGRYWAMDRDERWDRTKKAYEALTEGKGEKYVHVIDAVEASYNKGKTDEFIEPSIITDDKGDPVAIIKNNDALVFFNFRIDRPRQLTKAFVLKDFSNASELHEFDPYRIDYENTHNERLREKINTFDRRIFLSNIYFSTMTQYSKPIVEAGAKVAFPPVPVVDPLGKIISENNLMQLRITESEKERFVTFYFNGLQEEPYKGEKRIIIQSPQVPTYDQKPEMSSQKLLDTLLKEMTTCKYSLIVVNFPNVDMVGHTGNIGPAVKAVETVDYCIGKIANYVLAYDGVLIIIADHGNAEEMINLTTGEIDTEHSTNKVPFIAVDAKLMGKNITLTPGILADVAPTILSLLNITIPQVMTGRDLLKGLKD
ncbi:2,3-bisphosphoglycerate-independent phosphoglycerate mutase [Candidatus Woesebacteria bacterium]|nr:MAG: 2,3-bisphosphoglycerate-independent phosphoglycerate mutase [Candidatus Woesebacteria bacterium]